MQLTALEVSKFSHRGSPEDETFGKGYIAQSTSGM